MSKRRRSHVPQMLLVILALALLAMPLSLSGQGLRSFTVDDALRVRSVNTADATDDARWIATTVSTARGRMNTDHFRFGDPTYIGPSLGEMFVVDAETGTTQTPFEGEVQVTGLSWSPSGDRLAFLRLVGEEVRLEIWNRDSGRVRQVQLRPRKELVWGGSLEWLPDGSGVVLGVRREGWAEEARVAYEALELGPVVVQDSSEPFLSWDAVRNRGNLAELALVTVANGSLRILAPEAGYQDVRVGHDGTHITYSTATPQKTSYERSKGTEYAYYRLALTEGSTG